MSNKTMGATQELALEFLAAFYETISTTPDALGRFIDPKGKIVITDKDGKTSVYAFPKQINDWARTQGITHYKAETVDSIQFSQKFVLIQAAASVWTKTGTVIDFVESFILEMLGPQKATMHSMIRTVLDVTEGVDEMDNEDKDCAFVPQQVSTPNVSVVPSLPQSNPAAGKYQPHQQRSQVRETEAATASNETATGKNGERTRAPTAAELAALAAQKKAATASGKAVSIESSQQSKPTESPKDEQGTVSSQKESPEVQVSQPAAPNRSSAAPPKQRARPVISNTFGTEATGEVHRPAPFGQPHPTQGRRPSILVAFNPRPERLSTSTIMPVIKAVEAVAGSRCVHHSNARSSGDGATLLMDFATEEQVNRAVAASPLTAEGFESIVLRVNRK